MKASKILAVAVLSVSLYSCGCEDMDLGKLEFTNEFISFLPAQPALGKSYYVTIDDTDQKLSYVNATGTTTVVIPVRKKNYSGKLDPNSCKEYYTADKKVFTTQIEGENSVSITVTYKKEADPDRFNSTIMNKDEVGDMIEFIVGLNNKFPKPIQIGSSNISNYVTNRTFFFKDATTGTLENYAYKQEFIPSITLDGIQHEKVYHLVLGNYFHLLPEEGYISNSYTGLDAVKGIHLKEGIGIIHAYSFNGKQISISEK